MIMGVDGNADKRGLLSQLFVPVTLMGGVGMKGQ